MHVLVWAVLIYYLYAYGAARKSILNQLDRLKNESLWAPFVRWLSDRHFRADLEAAAGHELKNVGLSYQSDNEEHIDEKKAGNSIIRHADFSLSVELKERFLGSGLFSMSEKHEGWIQHIYTVTDDDLREFDRRRGYAISKNELVWLEYQLPYVGAWLLLLVGIVIYASWIFYPETWLGQLVPLEHSPPIAEKILRP
jgi:hypothetical protein